MSRNPFQITQTDILPLAEYLKHREENQEKIFHIKEARRISVGPNFTFHFENKETLVYQIQEMIRVEHITAPEAIQHEINTYSELLPAANQLSATLMIEIPERFERERQLRALKDVLDFITLEVDKKTIPVTYDPRQLNPQRISSVQFLKFRCFPSGSEFKLPQYVTLKVSHPSYAYSTELSVETIHLLWHDLQS